MKRIVNVSVLLLVFFILTACDEDSIQTETNTSIDSSFASTLPAIQTGDTLVHYPIKLYPVTDSPEFEDAILDLNSPSEDEVLKSNLVHFSYDIKNYELSKPTKEGHCMETCANSAKGQHIHLILNNQPYLAKYSTSFTDTLQPGHYVALSFLSRSYHESIKHYEAYDLRQFTVGEIPASKLDLTKPMLFYSRPKGEYKGEETKKILLDFYLVNANLSPNDYKVRVTINDNVFMLSFWKAYIIEGLPMGESTIRLELIDKNGKMVEGKTYADIERKITLSDK